MAKFMVLQHNLALVYLVYNPAIITAEVFGEGLYYHLKHGHEWLSDDMEAVQQADYVPGASIYAGPNAGGYLRFGVLQYASWWWICR